MATLEQRILALAQTMAATCKAQRQDIAVLQQRVTAAEQAVASLNTQQAAAMLSMVEALKLTSDNNRLILKLFGI